MLCHEGKISLYSYLCTIALFTSFYVPLVLIIDLKSTPALLTLVIFLIYAVLNIILKCCHKNLDYEVSVRATFLGFIFSSGVYLFLLGTKNVYIFGLYMCVMSFFHYSEFLSIAYIRPTDLSTNSFLLYHSPQYVMAATFSWLEFGIETYFFPEAKTFTYLSYLGFFMCLLGEFLRKLAMLTACSNFNHMVQCTKSKDQVLVTHGVYSVCRHPSYVGWFYWSIGTQIILLNPVSIIAYAIASWLFFNERITMEEITLLSFFGQQYCDYQKNVGTGLPFIQGYLIKP